MAAPAVTPAAIQAVLGADAGSPQILSSYQTLTATIAGYYVEGRATVPGRVRWIATTNTDSAATQAAAILTGLRA